MNIPYWSLPLNGPKLKKLTLVQVQEHVHSEGKGKPSFAFEKSTLMMAAHYIVWKRLQHFLWLLANVTIVGVGASYDITVHVAGFIVNKPS